MLNLPKATVYGSSLRPPASVLLPLSTSGPIFLAGGAPWTWFGVSAFPLCDMFGKGGRAAIDPFIDAYPGANVFRVWDYVPWAERGWNVSPANVWIDFLGYMRVRGLLVERTALTDDDPRRIEPAIRTIEAITAAGCDNVLHEGGNEPETHKETRTHDLIPVMQASGRPWTTGDYENSQYWRGTYGVYHPARTTDFARRAHDAYEYYRGGGPNSNTEPACRVPWVNDEPGKIQDVGADRAAWIAHAAASILLGAGITFHSETGKFGDLPTADERAVFQIVRDTLALIPSDAALGPYRRIDAAGEGAGQNGDQGRTYVVGNFMVRCQQLGTKCPEAGWAPLDDVGVLWRR
jgi:hypothetical protein